MNGTNTVNIAKILIHLKLEKTFFTKRILSLLDADCSGDLDFGEFLVGVWNYCSIDNKYLGMNSFTRVKSLRNIVKFDVCSSYCFLTHALTVSVISL